MIAEWVVIASGLGYLGVLFLLAYWVERRARQGRSRVNNPYVYALSLAVYCTAWTYYGSVGLASTSGLEFVTIYLGPTLMAPLSWLVLRKMIRICRVHRIGTLADFISARYGKSVTLGAVVTLLCVLAVIPYISLQLKAISSSYELLVDGPAVLTGGGVRDTIWQDSSLTITLLLALFTILFGTRHVDATVRREGMVAAIAFESLFKLFAFLVVGAAVTWWLFGGFGDVFARAMETPELSRLLTLDTSHSNWTVTLGLSMLAIVLLPRQFQVSVLENVNERHLDKAMWLFPLYLLVINIFVLPIAIGGRLLLAPGADADLSVLSLPLTQGWTALALLVYLGGFAAATSMIIIETTALSLMLSNHLLMPLLVASSRLHRRMGDNMGGILMTSRRVNIVAVLLLAYIYFHEVVQQFTLVSIGLISFAGVAQFGPALFGGLYWKMGTKRAALAGLVVGFAVWFYTLVVPTIVAAGLLPAAWMTEGPFGLALLRPQELLGLTGLDPLAHGAFWSLMLNTGIYVGVSLFDQPSSQERYQAELFVDVFRHSASAAPAGAAMWQGKADKQNLNALLETFLGQRRADRLLQDYARRNPPHEQDAGADTRFAAYVERLLAGVVGAASARLVVARAVQEADITLADVYGILQESQQLIALNKELKRTSRALQEATAQLTTANQRLQELDQMKDEFISTVTHEMRTPVTAIRAMAEILHDNPDLDPAERAHFLNTIAKECERMNRLVNQVLDLEQLERGVQQLGAEPLDLAQVVQAAADSVRQLAREQQTNLVVDLPQDLPTLTGDSDRLQQVVLNLLGNALKFCDRQAGEVRVTVRVADGMVVVTVADNGPGLAEESLPYLFDKFFQDRQQHLRKPKGTGLGLAISKKIVALHGGHIWAENDPGGGARFHFTIPLQAEEGLSAPHDRPETRFVGG